MESVKIYCFLLTMSSNSVIEETHKGSSGRPFRTSSVFLRPNAGRELMLKSPLFKFVVFRKVWSSVVVSTRVGLPILFSG